MRHAAAILAALSLLGSSAIVEGEIVPPETVRKAVNATYPNAEIGKTGVEREAGIRIYDIELKAGRGEIEVAEDGTVMEITTIVGMADIPAAAAETVHRTIKGAEIEEIEKTEVRAEIRHDGKTGSVVRLDVSSFFYVVKVARGWRSAAMKVAPDGGIVQRLKWSRGGRIR